MSSFATQYFGNPSHLTTYKETYLQTKTLPPIKFNQPPAFQLPNEPQLNPRFFPLIPRGPHRRLKLDIPMALGLGTNDVQPDKSPKPIVRTAPPREIINDVPKLSLRKLHPRSAKARRCPPMPIPTADGAMDHLPPEVIDAICDHVTWTSTTRVATEEAKLPINQVAPPQSTCEDNADMVKYRPQKYESRPELWQEVAVPWDCAQTRPPLHHPLPETRVRLKRCPLLARRKPCDNTRIMEKIRELTKKRDLNTPFVRQCPGYAGFVPRSPIEAGIELPPAQPQGTMTSVMQSSYRALPSEEYRILKRAHKGPMSRTVTLTYPYNPFNKLEKREA